MVYALISKLKTKLILIRPGKRKFQNRNYAPPAPTGRNTSTKGEALEASKKHGSPVRATLVFTAETLRSQRWFPKSAIPNPKFLHLHLHLNLTSLLHVHEPPTFRKRNRNHQRTTPLRVLCASAVDPILPLRR